MRDPDVLDLAAREHRELQRAIRHLLKPGGQLAGSAEQVDAVVSSIARHEAMDRLLLYPLVGRDAYGRRTLVERRAEQRSISDQLAKIRRTFCKGHLELRDAVDGLRVTFTGHSDREEIEDFPHARRLSSVDERHQLGELRAALRNALHQRLPKVPTSAEVRGDGVSADRLGPIQIAIVNAKQILVELDRSIIGVA